MKLTKTSVLMVLAAIPAMVLSQTAFADKTRQEVRQELALAYHEGVVPSPPNDYPPSEARVLRNKELHAVTTHAGEQVPALDNHDDPAVR